MARSNCHLPAKEHLVKHASRHVELRWHSGRGKRWALPVRSESGSVEGFDRGAPRREDRLVPGWRGTARRLGAAGERNPAAS